MGPLVMAGVAADPEAVPEPEPEPEPSVAEASTVVAWVPLGQVVTAEAQYEEP